MLDQVAVFVDGDNVSADHATQIESFGVKLGDPILQRVYGDIVRMPKWQKQSSFAMVHSGTGKNATDILITIDALEIALSGSVQTVLIASSDSDYRHLAFRLRERGVSVVAMGEAETKTTFRNACTDFVELPPIKTALRPCIKKTEATPLACDLDLKIHAVVKASGSQGHGIKVEDLNHIMRNKHQVKISTKPEKNWRGYLSKRPHLYDLDPRGKNARVRSIASGIDART